MEDGDGDRGKREEQAHDQDRWLYGVRSSLSSEVKVRARERIFSPTVAQTATK